MPKWISSLSALAAALMAVLSGVLVPVSYASAQARAYSVTVESENGYNLPVFYQGGQAFVLGSYGERYNIRVRNLTGRRVEAVVTVDGRDVVSGDVGDYTRQRGYVLPAYGDVLIEGFRQSMSHVAAFRFTSPGDSYSSRRGTPQNVGVIGVAFFAERYVPPPAPPIAIPSPQPRPYSGQPGYDRRMSSQDEGRARGGMGTGSAAPSAPAAEASAGDMASRSAPARSSSPRAYQESEARDDVQRESNIGTRYGETRHNQARQVTFVRAHATRPDHVTTLRYDNAEGLMARGIEVYPRPQPRPYVQVNPEAFPANRFAPPPP